MKCWVDRGRTLHIECGVDLASEIALALDARSRVNVLKAPGLEEASQRIGAAVSHMLGTHDEAPHKPGSGNHPLSATTDKPSGK